MSDQIPNEKRVEELKKKVEKINQTSPSFCLAKWLQSTVYLHSGMTHSCHHPSPHKIPVKEIIKDPSALHNTEFKQKVRQKMLKGERPKECGYCWNIEDLGQGHLSDRHYKSADQWAFPYLDDVLQVGSKPIPPKYLEVAFDSTCNFKCAYCSPDISSKWMEEIKTHGPYPTSNKTGNLEWLKSSGRMPIKKSEKNHYIEAFWSWWPQIYSQLHTFRITGGEPLLSQNTWRILDFLKVKESLDLNLAINTNLGVPDQLIDRFIDNYKLVRPRLKSFEVFTSCEAYAEQAEYTRFGLNYKKFIENIERFLDETGGQSRVNIMVTFNVLSVPSFGKFLEEVWRLREKYNETDAMNRVPMMTNYLRWPEFLSMRVLTPEIKSYWANQYLDIVHRFSKKSRPGKPGRFYLEEIDQVERLCKYMMAEPKDVHHRRKDFALFIQEYDKRKNVNFSHVFPELEKFYETCKSLV